jgi:hypothetical protein
MPRRLIMSYAMLPRGGSGVPPPRPPPLPQPAPQEPAPPQADDDDEEFYASLPNDAAAEEAAGMQRALLASFETQRRNESVWHFMHAERRAAAARQADTQATAHADAHRRNLKAARTVMAVAEQSLAEADQSGGLASVAEARHRRENQYPGFV